MNRITLRFIDGAVEKNFLKTELFFESKETKLLKSLILFLSFLSLLLNAIIKLNSKHLTISLILFLYQIVCNILYKRSGVLYRLISIISDSLCLVYFFNEITESISSDSPQLGFFLQGLYLGLYLTHSKLKTFWLYQTMAHLMSLLLFFILRANSWDFMMLLIFPGIIILGLSSYSKEFVLRRSFREEPVEVILKDDKAVIKEIFKEIFQFDNVAVFNMPFDNVLDYHKFRFPSIEDNCIVTEEAQINDVGANPNFFFSKSKTFFISEKLAVEQDFNNFSITDLVNQTIIDVMENQEVFHKVSKENLSLSEYLHRVLPEQVVEKISKEKDVLEAEFQALTKKFICSHLSTRNPILLKLGLKFRVILNIFSSGKELFIVTRFKKESEKKKIKQLLKDQQDSTLFLASIVHDLRSPLVGIEYMIDAAAENMNKIDDNMNHLKMAKSNCQLLSCLIDDILDFTSSKNNKFRIVLSYFCLNDLIKEVISIMKPDADLRNLILEYSTPIPYDMKVNSDPKRLKQVLINLISNALKFTSVGYVRVSALKKDDYILEIHVSDTGSGIKKDMISLLSQPYLTLDNEAGGNKRGIGLGLHNCKQILKFLGPGGLMVNSTEGLGSDFGFMIYRDVHNPTSDLLSCMISRREPHSKTRILNRYLSINSMSLDEYEKDMVKTDVVMEQRSKIASIKRPNSDDVIPKRKLKTQASILPSLSALIVDDNPFNLLVLEKYLMSLKNMEINLEKCLNGQAAIETFKINNAPGSINPFNLIFLDIQIPLKNGFEVCEEINNLIIREGYERCPVYGITGLLEEIHHKMALKTGMKSILSKPISIDIIHKICCQDQIF